MDQGYSSSSIYSRPFIATNEPPIITSTLHGQLVLNEAPCFWLFTSACDSLEDLLRTSSQAHRRQLLCDVFAVLATL